jgi:PAS domain S-box-containing protein
MPDTQAQSAAAKQAADQQKLTLFEAVFEALPDIVLLKDAQGNFLLCNHTLARLYNTTPEAMVGKHDGDFGMPKALADSYRANVLDIMARGETEVVFEDSRNAVTGEIRHFKSIKKPFKDADGNNQILVIAHDITDVVRAQQQVAVSEQRLQEVMAATREGIWDWHVTSGRVEHNAQWFRILGFAEGEITSHVDAFSARIHPDDKPAVWQRLRQLLSSGDEFYSSEHRMLRKDGAVIWVLDRGRVAERNTQGEVVRVVGAYVDISERKRHEAALQQALAQANNSSHAG